MKKLFLVPLLLLLVIVPMSYAVTLAEHTSANLDCDVTGGRYFAFSFNDSVIIDTISLYGYYNLTGNTTAQYTIYSNNQLVNFSSGVTLQTSLANVSNVSGEIVIDFTDEDFVYNNDTYYWLKMGSDPDICYQTFYDGSTDVYTNGGIDNVLSRHDPRFEITGSIYDANNRSTQYESNETATEVQLYNPMVFYYTFDTDVNVTYFSHWRDAHQSGVFNQDKDVTISFWRLNTSLCTSGIETHFNNDSCFIDTGISFTDTTDFLGGRNVQFSGIDTVLNGTDIYQIRSDLYWGYSGNRLEFLQIINRTELNITDTNPLYVQYDLASVTTLYDSDLVFYHELQATALDTCSGENCAEENITIPQPINATGYVTSEERENAIGLLFDTQDEENPSKLTLKGVFISGFIIIAVMVTLVTITTSPVILASVFIKLVVLCVILKTLPFYIALLIIISVLGFSIFKAFSGTGQNGG